MDDDSDMDFIIESSQPSPSYRRKKRDDFSFKLSLCDPTELENIHYVARTEFLSLSGKSVSNDPSSDHEEEFVIPETQQSPSHVTEDFCKKNHTSSQNTQFIMIENDKDLMQTAEIADSQPIFNDLSLASCGIKRELKLINDESDLFADNDDDDDDNSSVNLCRTGDEHKTNEFDSDSETDCDEIEILTQIVEKNSNVKIPEAANLYGKDTQLSVPEPVPKLADDSSSAGPSITVINSPGDEKFNELNDKERNVVPEVVVKFADNGSFAIPSIPVDKAITITNDQTMFPVTDKIIDSNDKESEENIFELQTQIFPHFMESTNNVKPIAENEIFAEQLNSLAQRPIALEKHSASFYLNATQVFPTPKTAAKRKLQLTSEETSNECRLKSKIPNIFQCSQELLEKSLNVSLKSTPTHKSILQNVNSSINLTKLKKAEELFKILRAPSFKKSPETIKTPETKGVRKDFKKPEIIDKIDINTRSKQSVKKHEQIPKYVPANKFVSKTIVQSDVNTQKFPAEKYNSRLRSKATATKKMEQKKKELAQKIKKTITQKLIAKSPTREIICIKTEKIQPISRTEKSKTSPENTKFIMLQSNEDLIQSADIASCGIEKKIKLINDESNLFTDSDSDTDCDEILTQMVEVNMNKKAPETANLGGKQTQLFVPENISKLADDSSFAGPTIPVDKAITNDKTLSLVKNEINDANGKESEINIFELQTQIFQIPTQFVESTNNVDPTADDEKSAEQLKPLSSRSSTLEKHNNHNDSFYLNATQLFRPPNTPAKRKRELTPERTSNERRLKSKPTQKSTPTQKSVLQNVNSSSINLTKLKKKDKLYKIRKAPSFEKNSETERSIKKVQTPQIVKLHELNSQNHVPANKISKTIVQSDVDTQKFPVEKYNSRLRTKVAVSAPATKQMEKKKKELDQKTDKTISPRNIEKSPARAICIKREKADLEGFQSDNIRNLRPKQIYKIMATLLKMDYSAEIKNLGGKVTDPEDANILIANKITRSFKFLCAVAKGIPIVNEKWIRESINSKTFLDKTKFLLKDEFSETLHKIVLSESLRRARRNPLLKDVTVICTPSTKPEPEVMKDIIACAGGKFTTLYKSKIETTKQLILTDIHQNDRRLSQQILRRHPNTQIITDDAFLKAILKQEIDL